MNEVTLENAHEGCDFDHLRAAAENVRSAIGDAESCEAVEDYEANLESAIESAKAIVKEARSALSELRALRAKAAR